MPLSAPGAPGAPWLVAGALHLCSALSRPYPSPLEGPAIDAGPPGPGRSLPEALHLTTSADPLSNRSVSTVIGDIFWGSTHPLHPRPSVYSQPSPHDSGHVTHVTLWPRFHGASYRGCYPGIAGRFSRATQAGLCDVHPGPCWGHSAAPSSPHCPLEGARHHQALTGP